MEKKRNPLLIWIVGLVVAALVLTDMLPLFVQAQEVAVTPSPRLELSQEAPQRILVAQEQQQPRRRKTLMDLLFGGDDSPPETTAPVHYRPGMRHDLRRFLPGTVQGVRVQYEHEAGPDLFRNGDFLLSLADLKAGRFDGVRVG